MILNKQEWNALQKIVNTKLNRENYFVTVDGKLIATNGQIVLIFKRDAIKNSSPICYKLPQIKFDSLTNETLSLCPITEPNTYWVNQIDKLITINKDQTVANYDVEYLSLIRDLCKSKINPKGYFKIQQYGTNPGIVDNYNFMAIIAPISI